MNACPTCGAPRTEIPAKGDGIPHYDYTPAVDVEGLIVKAVQKTRDVNWDEKAVPKWAVQQITQFMGEYICLHLKTKNGDD